MTTGLSLGIALIQINQDVQPMVNPLIVDMMEVNVRQERDL
jgi:hypothetical protein